MQNNTTIAGKFWLEGTNDFQQRIPNPTIHGMDMFTKAIFDPLNNDLFNQFTNGIINRVGMTIVKDKAFKNKLAGFKKSPIYYGKTVQEIAFKYVKAHSYVDDSETVWKMERPELEEWFYTINRFDRYPLSIVRSEWQHAMTSENGLNQLINAEISALVSSDEYDEQNIMLELFGYAEENWGEGLYKIQTAEPVDKETGQAFLAKVRATANRMTVAPSTVYNSVKVPVFANTSEMILITTPEVDSYVDVYTLAEIFNVAKADLESLRIKKVVVPEIPIDGAFAVLTTGDFFECRDSVFGFYNAPFNAETLADKIYLHHQGIYSASPFVPCAVFTSNTSTTVPVVKQEVTGIDATMYLEDENKGTALTDVTVHDINNKLAIVTTLQGTIAGDDSGSIVVAPDAVLYNIASTGKLGAATYVDRLGILHVGSTVKGGDKLTITVTSSYINPNGQTTKYTKDVTITIAQDTTTQQNTTTKEVTE